jgi:outer membrane autotransporter protein
MNTVLGDDTSPMDRLVINGTTSGSTVLNIVNAGGLGAQTTNGIMVVQVNGASAGTFTLATPVAAGPYEYELSQNGTNNWYLDSMLNCALDPSVSACQEPPTPPTPPPPPPEVPLYRQEVPGYSQIALLARQMGLMEIGTFHEREGDEFLHDQGQGAVWGRFEGEGLNQKFAGPVSPAFNGIVDMAQVGSDLYVSNDHEDFAGPFASYAHAYGDVQGTVLAQENTPAGSLPTASYSVGGYYTHIGKDGTGEDRWYVDAVVMKNWFDSRPRSLRGVGVHVSGSGVDASLEGGYNIDLGGQWLLEPMAQIVYSTMSFGNAADPYSSMSFQAGDAWFGRAGARLEDHTVWFGASITPFLEANLWHGSNGTDTVTYDDTTPIATPFGNSNVELATGFSTKLDDNNSAYARVSYSTGFAGNYQQIVKGEIGYRFVW